MLLRTQQKERGQSAGVCACVAVFRLYVAFHKVNEQEGLDAAQSHRTCTRSSSGSQRLTSHMSSASSKQVAGIPEVPRIAGVVPGVNVCVQGRVCACM